MNINRCLPVIRATLPLKFPKPEAMINDRQNESTVFRTFALFTANYSVISVIAHGNSLGKSLGHYSRSLALVPSSVIKYI